MSKNTTFARLLRDTGIARYNRKIPQVYARAAPFAGELDLTFGMKREFCNKYWGRPLEFVQVTDLDAEYGFPEFSNASDEYHKFVSWKELFYKLGTRANDLELSGKIYKAGNSSNSLASTVYADENYPANNQKVLGRLLNRTKNGYTIGIGGLVALLPDSEVPLGIKFHQTDFIARKALLMTVKHAAIHNNSLNEPHIVVSLK